MSLDPEVMVCRLAGHVGVLAGREVEALQDVAVREKIKRAEDHGAPDAQPTITCVIDQVGCREVPFTARDQVRDGASRLSGPIASEVERRHKRLRICHDADDN